MVDYLVIVGYLVGLIVLSYFCNQLNSNVSDYFRSGCRGLWWLVGSSIFMSTFSAWTFTGASSVAYEAGYSVSVIYIANVAGFAVAAIWSAPWLRQMRATTVPEVLRERFGEHTQQFYAWFGMFMKVIYGSLTLYGLAIFCSAIFGFDIAMVIVVLGFVVLFYSMTGGSWAVMSTDFMQGLILMPVTVLLAVLCLIKIGGFAGLHSGITQAGLTESYQMFNTPQAFGGDYTISWATAILVQTVLGFNAMGAAVRYFAVKDGKHARHASWLAAGLMLAGAIIWIIPPMVARLLYADEVTAIQIARPSEAAYAVASLHLLPRGMMGLMVVGMLAATMSTMDTGLNQNAAILVKDIYPGFMKLLGRPLGSDHRQLAIGRLATVGFGMIIITLALYFAKQSGQGVFGLMIAVGTKLGIPMCIPLLLGMFSRRDPGFSAIVSGVTGLVVSLTLWYLQSQQGVDISLLTHVLGTTAGSVTGFMICLWGLPNRDPLHQQKVDAFLKKMHTPVDVPKEVGQFNGHEQYKLLGTSGLIAGLLIACIMFAQNTLADWICTLSISIFVMFCSLLLLRRGFVLARVSDFSPHVLTMESDEKNPENQL